MFRLLLLVSEDLKAAPSATLPPLHLRLLAYNLQCNEDIGISFPGFHALLINIALITSKGNQLPLARALCTPASDEVNTARFASSIRIYFHLFKATHVQSEVTSCAEVLRHNVFRRHSILYVSDVPQIAPKYDMARTHLHVRLFTTRVCFTGNLRYALNFCSSLMESFMDFFYRRDTIS